ncbi:hypothetical protein A2863_01545 [Candidatus Woesebacteria bacterium RIFCSPHIGHO2_01_FULL_38_9b]|uniref:Uncharacterized protein n=1 Tax=Candidatus Woesebacteria bacterium RIFCSPHIGHO2_01_FULL_38_9b TaxID=1802493 RepID=A0A1F7Y0X1_9BACT|nr:MAG: hypothetical protein A2863_01545 [Candidatus Woesebacteria bacterium RIFCSPHIGHO2_01_FULL_38_9b]
MKKDTFIIIFYFIYFSWLFTITYLTPKTDLLNYFTLSIIFFYFVLLRESGDLFWFWLGTLIPILFNLSSFTNFEFKFDLAKIILTPIWLPLAWGTTIIALRKFYLIITR